MPNSKPSLPTPTPSVRSTWRRHPLRGLGWALWLVPLHAALLIWGTWEHQPSPASQFTEWAAFVTTNRFVWSHVVASIGGQTLAVIGVAAVTAVALAEGGHPRRAVAGFVMHAVGSGLMIAGFGVAAMVQPVIGDLHRSHPDIARDVYDGVYGPLTYVLLLSGLALFSSSTAVLASACRPLAAVPTWARRAFAAAGPVFGILGFLLGPIQTLGAVMLLVSTVRLAAGLRAALADVEVLSAAGDPVDS